jgi:hypothetical protein
MDDEWYAPCVASRADPAMRPHCWWQGDVFHVLAYGATLQVECDKVYNEEL